MISVIMPRGGYIYFLINGFNDIDDDARDGYDFIFIA